MRVLAIGTGIVQGKLVIETTAGHFAGDIGTADGARRTHQLHLSLRLADGGGLSGVATATLEQQTGGLSPIVYTMPRASNALAHWTELRRAEDAWGQPTAQQPEFFFADDVPPTLRSALPRVVALATARWGNFGPLEYWVVGKSEAAAQGLLRAYCRRRGDPSVDPTRFGACVRTSRQAEEWPEWAALAASGSPARSAGLNTQREDNVFIISSSLPLGLAGEETRDGGTYCFANSTARGLC